MEKFCPKCHKIHEDMKDKFCSNCGTKLKTREKKKTNTSCIKTPNIS